VFHVERYVVFIRGHEDNGLLQSVRYAKLIKNVRIAVCQFCDKNPSRIYARPYLVDDFPSSVNIVVGSFGGQSSLTDCRLKDACIVLS
jgi:hypothetical protein